MLHLQLFYICMYLHFLHKASFTGQFYTASSFLLVSGAEGVMLVWRQVCPGRRETLLGSLLEYPAHNLWQAAPFPCKLVCRGACQVQDVQLLRCQSVIVGHDGMPGEEVTVAVTQALLL